MSRPLVYFPAYLGLFAAQILAMTCNAFLDIKYQSFGREVTLWALAFGTTLCLGWLQRGRITAAGKWGQGIAVTLACLISLTVFIPLWGFPRAGLSMLAALQAALNCVTVTRRHLHLGILTSAVMVMFATSHYRADWSMLFYLIPYVTAVVFTLVAEQINSRSQDLKNQSPGHQVIGGQAVAIAAATSTILLLAGLLYAITPQLTQPYLKWRYGQLTGIGKIGNSMEVGPGNQAGGQAGDPGEQQGNNGQSQGGELVMGHAWPSSTEMRQAAQRTGMPEWQRGAILRLADASQWMEMTMKPLLQDLKKLLQSLKEWLSEHRQDITRIIFVLIALLLLYGLWRLIREAKVGTWILTRLDYLRFGVFGLHSHSRDGARQYYRAMERLFTLDDAERSHLMNTREYLALLYGSHRHLRHELSEMTQLFEEARYGSAPVLDARLNRMRSLYREIYRSL